MYLFLKQKQKTNIFVVKGELKWRSTMGSVKRNVIRNILTADSWSRWLRIDVCKLQKQDCDYCHFVPAVRVCISDLGTKKTHCGYCHFVLTVCIGDLGTKNTHCGYCHFVLTVCIGDLGKKKTGYCHFVLTVCIGDLGKKKTVVTAILCPAVCIGDLGDKAKMCGQC